MTGPAPTASDYFGQMAASYDSLIRRAVPRYDEMIDRLMSHLLAGPARILELGCGTGNTTLRLLKQFPGTDLVAVDAAPEMTALTAARASALGNRVHPLRTMTARFEDISFPPGSFDLIASCMSLHHVRDKAAIYRRFREWLVPGGMLAFADQLLGANPESQRIHWNAWLAHCRQAGNCTEEEITSLLEHAAAHDHYVSLPDHSRLLADSGFREPDCVWRNLMYTVITTRRR